MANPSAAVSKKPDWSKLPVTLSPQWYDFQYIHRAVAVVFAFLATGFSGSSFYFTAKLPQVILLLGAGAASLLFARKCWAPSLNDPQIALDLRKKAGLEIEGSKMTYAIFLRTYQGLLSKGILQTADIVPLLERDVDQMNYVDFVKKHAGTDLTCKQALFQALSPASYTILRVKGLWLFATEPARVKDAWDKEILNESDSSELSVNEEALRAKDFNTFISKFSPDQLQPITDPQAEEVVKGLFLAEAYRGKTEHRKYLNIFRNEVALELQKTLRIFELELFCEGKVSFQNMVWNEGWPDLEVILSLIDHAKVVELKEKLAVALILHCFSEANADIDEEKYKSLRETLGITPEKIESALRSECDRMDYLGPEGFWKKYGSRPLGKGVLKSQQLEKIKRELRQTLPPISMTARDPKIWEDVVTLGLQDEINIAHFQSMTLWSIWKHEKQTFLDFCRQNGTAAGMLRSKIIKETESLSILELIYDYPELFQIEFLLANAQRSDGKTFAAHAEDEVPSLNNIDATVVANRRFFYGIGPKFCDLLPKLFEYGLLNLQSPALRKLIKEFLDKEGGEVLRGEGHTLSRNFLPGYKMWNQLFAIPQIFTQAVIDALKTASSDAKRAHELWSVENSRLQDQNYRASSPKEKAYTSQSALANAAKSGLENVRQQKARLIQSLDENTKKLEVQQTALVALKTSLKGLPELKKTLQEQIHSLAGERPPSVDDFIALTRQISADEIHLEQMRGDPSLQLTDVFKVAEETLTQKKREQGLKTSNLETWNGKLKALEKLRAQERAVNDEIERCRSEAPGLVATIEQTQAVCDGLKKEHSRLSAEENRLCQNIQQREESEEALRSELDHDRRAFEHEKERKSEEIRSQYHEKMKQILEKFEKVLIPPKA